MLPNRPVDLRKISRNTGVTYYISVKLGDVKMQHQYRYQKVIDRCNHILVTNVDFLDICGRLIQDGILSRDQAEAISEEKGNKARMSRFIDHFVKVDLVTLYPRFVQILEENGNSGHVVTEMTRVESERQHYGKWKHQHY